MKEVAIISILAGTIAGVLTWLLATVTTRTRRKGRS